MNKQYSDDLIVYQIVKMDEISKEYLPLPNDSKLQK